MRRIFLIVIFNSEFKKGSKGLTFFPEIFHSRFFKNFKRCTMNSHREYGSIAHLPAGCARLRMKTFLHFETGVFMVSPPPGKSGERKILSMFFMNENSAYSTRPAVQVLITAP